MAQIRLPYLATAGALLAIATLTPANAHPEVAGPTGRKCILASFSDTNPEADANDDSGTISAGPMTTEVAGTLHCSVQVNAQNHSGPNAVTRSFASDANGLVAGTQTASYSTGDPGSLLFMCASFQMWDGTTIYYTPRDPGTSDPTGTEYYWTTNPDVACATVAVQTSETAVIGAVADAVNDNDPPTPAPSPTASPTARANGHYG